MGMTIDIDGSIKELSKWRKDFNYDNGDYCYGDDTTKYSLDMAIDTMRKYQKIEDLVNDCADESVDDTSCCARYIGLIEEIIYTEEQEDGNDK